MANGLQSAESLHADIGLEPLAGVPGFEALVRAR